jgi:hypothetical protein
VHGCVEGCTCGDILIFVHSSGFLLRYKFLFLFLFLFPFSIDGLAHVRLTWVQELMPGTAALESVHLHSSVPGCIFNYIDEAIFSTFKHFYEAKE